MELSLILRCTYLELIKDAEKINNKYNAKRFFEGLFNNIEDPIYK